MNKKNYVELNDNSTTNKIENSSINQINKSSFFDQSKGIQPKLKSKLFNYQNNPSLLTSSSNNSHLKKKTFSQSKQYKINSNNFKIWHNDKVKCISYHGIEYFSTYKPKNNSKNLYIKLGKDGNFIYLGDDNVQDFNYDDFILRMNSLVNPKKVLTSIIHKYKCLSILLKVCLGFILIFLSFFIFFILYSLLLYFLFKKKVELFHKYYLLGLFGFKICSLIAILFAIKKNNESKHFNVFAYLQGKKETIQTELNFWNEKTFSLINKKALLAENFEYIHIKYE